MDTLYNILQEMQQSNQLQQQTNELLKQCVSFDTFMQTMLGPSASMVSQCHLAPEDYGMPNSVVYNANFTTY